MFRLRRMDLQAKIILILVAVIVPTFVFVTIVENKLTQPILSDEMKQTGITSGKTLAAEIVSKRLLALAKPTPVIEGRLQEYLYSHPHIQWIDVLVNDPETGLGKVIASSVEEEVGEAEPAQVQVSIPDKVTSELRTDENGTRYWDVMVPFEARKKTIGAVRVVVSMRFVQNTVGLLWRITAGAAAFTVVVLVFALWYFLRKTIQNDRRLLQVEDQKLQLTAQLHEAERQLMNMEKLAVMGQLTASFAHEIGTPLNAIGGHLQLLREDLVANSSALGRMQVIDGQVNKIEKIVKNFLQSTVKPTSQRQLIDVNRLADQTLGIVRPRMEAMAIEARRDFDWEMGPIRVVPLDLEQILLNLVNNSLDSLKAKREAHEKGKFQLEIKTRVRQEESREWAVISVFDTGQGIRKVDLPKITKPFFTTKRPGEGTGLGLAICQQLAHKYGGMLEFDSKEGGWTRVSVRLPYGVS